MAVIKFRADANSPWAIYNGPLNVLSGKNYEYVKISSTTKNAFPDLSPYVSDLGQIVAMTWCTDDEPYIYFNAYFRGADDGNFGRNISCTRYQITINNLTTGGYHLFTQGTWEGTLTGTPDAIDFGWSASRSTDFRGNIIIYYEGDEA